MVLWKDALIPRCYEPSRGFVGGGGGDLRGAELCLQRMQAEEEEEEPCSTLTLKLEEEGRLERGREFGLFHS